MSDDKTVRVQEVLDTVRMLCDVIKNEDIPQEQGDKVIGTLIAKLDYLMTQIDALTGDEPK